MASRLPRQPGHQDISRPNKEDAGASRKKRSVPQPSPERRNPDHSRGASTDRGRQPAPAATHRPVVAARGRKVGASRQVPTTRPVIPFTMELRSDIPGPSMFESITREENEKERLKELVNEGKLIKEAVRRLNMHKIFPPPPKKFYDSDDDSDLTGSE